MKKFFRSLLCLFRSHCTLFTGDDYTDWLREQGRASQQGRRELRDDPITRTIRGEQ